MRYILLALLLIGYSQAGRAAEPLSRLRVQGVQLVNEQGDAVQLRGVGLMDASHWFERNRAFRGDAVVAKIAADMPKANVVRLPVNATFWREFYQHPKGAIRMPPEGFPSLKAGMPNITGYYHEHLKAHLEQAQQHGLYVILDYHAIAGYEQYKSNAAGDRSVVKVIDGWDEPHHLSNALAFWQQIIPLLQADGFDNVLYEIFNEPGVTAQFRTNNASDATRRAAWAAWKPLAEELIQTVRAGDKAGVILVSTPYWCTDVRFAAENPITTDNNIAYVAHFYPGSGQIFSPDAVPDWHKPPYKVVADEAAFVAVYDRYIGDAAKVIPVVMTEYGNTLDTPEFLSTMGTVASFTQPMTEYLDARDISWVAYSFSTGGTLPLLGRNLEYLPAPRYAGTYFREVFQP